MSIVALVIAPLLVSKEEKHAKKELPQQKTEIVSRISTETPAFNK